MKTFLIYTEDKNRSQIEEILASKLDGFTLLYGQGFWASPRAEQAPYWENSLVIVVLTTDAEKVKDIAKEIKRVNNQESVMVTSFETEMEMI